MVTNCQNDHQKINFRFGVVIYRDLIGSQRTSGEKAKKPIIFDLTNNIDDIQSFLNDYVPSGGSIKFATDWACGYHSLLEDISWDDSAEKVVIQISNTPGHGRRFTININWHKKYLDIPKFTGKSYFKKNFEIYRDLQQKQNGWLSFNISKLAEQGIKFYCLNGNKIALYCFKKVSHLYRKRGGKKFVIKDLFGYLVTDSEDDSIDVDMLKDEIKNFVSNVVDSCSSVTEKDSENQFERKCNEKFNEDLNNFYKENKTNFRSETTETDDDDDSDRD